MCPPSASAEALASRRWQPGGPAQTPSNPVLMLASLEVEGRLRLGLAWPPDSQATPATLVGLPRGACKGTMLEDDPAHPPHSGIASGSAASKDLM